MPIFISTLMLDDLTGLHGHLFGQIGDGDRFGDLDLPGHRRSGPGKPVLGRATAGRPQTRTGLAATCRRTLGDVQFLAAVTGFRFALFLLAAALFVGELARALFFPLTFLVLGAAARLFALGAFFRLLAALFLGFFLGLFEGRQPLFFLALQAGFLRGLLLQSLLDFPLGARLLENLAGLLPVCIGGTDLLLYDFALDVGAPLTDLDIDRARGGARARARYAQFAYRLPLERDAAGSRCIAFHLAVAGAQVRQQLLLVVVGNRVVSTRGLDTGVVELRQQFLAVDAQYIGQL